MKGTLRALVLVLGVGTLMVPAVGMTIDEQTADANSTDTTTQELQPIFQPLTTVGGASIMLVAVGILFSWLGVFG
jgi:hypothetical protein